MSDNILAQFFLVICSFALLGGLLVEEKKSVTFSAEIFLCNCSIVKSYMLKMHNNKFKVKSKTVLAETELKVKLRLSLNITKVLLWRTLEFFEGHCCHLIQKSCEIRLHSTKNHFFSSPRELLKEFLGCLAAASLQFWWHFVYEQSMNKMQFLVQSFFFQILQFDPGNRPFKSNALRKKAFQGEKC